MNGAAGPWLLGLLHLAVWGLAAASVFSEPAPRARLLFAAVLLLSAALAFDCLANPRHRSRSIEWHPRPGGSPAPPVFP